MAKFSEANKKYAAKITIRLLLAAFVWIFITVTQNSINEIHKYYMQNKINYHNQPDAIYDVFFDKLPILSQSNAKLLTLIEALLLDITCILTISIFVMDNSATSMRSFIELFCGYALRQTVQISMILPTPKHSHYEKPGYPSLFVDYAIKTDFFFSGHTMVSILCVASLWRYFEQNNWTHKVFLVFIPMAEVFLLLILRAHYFCDIYAGAVTAFWLISISQKYAIELDKYLNGLINRLVVYRNVKKGC